MHLTRWLKPLLASVLTLLPFAPTLASGYPDRPIRIVVPSPAGGPNDAVTRILATRLEKIFNQAILVDARPGGAGLLGADLVARAKPDGYTLLLTYPAPIAVNLTPADPKGMVDLSRIEPISIVAELEAVLVVNNEVPADSVTSFVDYIREQDGNAKIAISAKGNFPQLATEQWLQSEGLSVKRVNYLGTAPAVKDLLGAHYDGVVEILPGVAPLVKSGRLKALAVTSNERSPFLPDVPSAREAGYPQLIASAWFTLAAPKGTPPEIIDRLATEVTRITASEEYREALHTLGGVPKVTSPAQSREFILSEQARARTLIEKLGLASQ